MKRACNVTGDGHLNNCQQWGVSSHSGGVSSPLDHEGGVGGLPGAAPEDQEQNENEAPPPHLMTSSLSQPATATQLSISSSLDHNYNFRVRS